MARSKGMGGGPSMAFEKPRAGDVYKRQEFEPYLGKWMDAITIYVVPFGALLCACLLYTSRCV